METEQFVKAADFDSVFLDKSFHMRPDGAIIKRYPLREAMLKRNSTPQPKWPRAPRRHPALR